MVRTTYAIILMLLISGCSATADKYPPRLYNQISVKIHIVDNLPGNYPKGVTGIAYYNRNPCEVYVLADVYPYVVMHEIMHCFSGNWHEGAPSSEYQHIID